MILEMNYATIYNGLQVEVHLTVDEKLTAD